MSTPSTSETHKQYLHPHHCFPALPQAVTISLGPWH